MIKFGSRKNLIYPTMLFVSIGLLKIVEYYLEENFKYGKFTLLFVWLFSKIIFGLIIVLYGYFTFKKRKPQAIINIDLAEINKKKDNEENKLKLYILIFLASFFDFFVSIVRTFYIKGGKVSKSIKNRIRCYQIFFSALLCYFTIRINLCKHHIFSLIIIFICLSMIVGTEIIYKEIYYFDKFKNYYPLILTVISNLGRTFLDTTEKYLFEFDYVNPYKVMMIEGIINFISLGIYYYFNGHENQFKDLNLKNKPFESNETINLIIFIVLIILYFVFAGTRNIYRVSTIKYFSPMARALTEAIFDPFQIAYKLRDHFKTVFYWVNVVCLVIMVFSSLVYNEFIILYCCGLEYNTHIEIRNRGNSFSIYNDEEKISINDDYELELQKKGKESLSNN